MSPFRVPAWTCTSCGADLAADGQHEEFHQLCWSCHRAESNGPVDDAYTHYRIAWRWGAAHLDDDTAQAAMTHAWLSIARSMLEVRAQLERIADGLEELA